MTQKATVLLTGASAQVGLHILPKLLEAGFDTFALSRRLSRQLSRNASRQVIKHPTSGARLSWFSPDEFDRLCRGPVGEPSWNEDSASVAKQPDPKISNAKILISAGPINLATHMLEQVDGVKRVVCLSTTSVFSKLHSSDQAEKKQIEEIVLAEQQLITQCAERNIELVILRPTLIYGCGMDENISRLAKFIQRFGFLPLAGAAEGLRQPLHVADLAELIVKAAFSEARGQCSYAVAGGSTLSYRAMVVKIFKALGKTERLIFLPPGLLAHAVAVAGKIMGSKGLNAAMVMRQNHDLVFEDSETRQRFEFKPRVFEPTPEDFKLPAELQQYLLSGF
jgi:nucleoside-diphosphate-sugar epimerase